MVQWLRHHISSSGGACSIPGWGTKIPYVTWCIQKKKKKKTLAKTLCPWWPGVKDQRHRWEGGGCGHKGQPKSLLVMGLLYILTVVDTQAQAGDKMAQNYIHTWVQAMLQKSKLGRGLCWCQYPVSDTVILLFKVLSLGETRWRVHELSLYYFLQMHVDLQNASICKTTATWPLFLPFSPANWNVSEMAPILGHPLDLGSGGAHITVTRWERPGPWGPHRKMHTSPGYLPVSSWKRNF